MIPIVVDTNVFVSALLSTGGGPSRGVIRSCLDRSFEPIMGVALFAEYEALLRRSSITRKSPLSDEEREDLFNAFLTCARWQKIYFLWRPDLLDEADNHVLELAVAGGARYIVTRNTKDFIRAELDFPHILIRDPLNFLKEV